MPVVKFFAGLNLKQKSSFLDGHYQLSVVCRIWVLISETPAGVKQEESELDEFGKIQLHQVFTVSYFVVFSNIYCYINLLTSQYVP